MVIMEIHQIQILLFLENIVTLSKLYQNCYFVIKYKNQNFIKQVGSNLIRKINEQENIEILKIPTY